jgi:redox-sensing transcriptional repressor
MNADKIPDIIIGRLPVYLRALQQLADKGVQTTSSQELGEIIGISAAQIRKDISQFGEFGKQGMGYSIAFLIERLRDILQVERIWDMAVVGMGDIGHAIARYQGFTNRGFRVVMVFDNDPQKVGKTIGEFEVFNAQDMVERLKQSRIKIAVLTVPAAVAQETAEQLVKAGVKAILNYAPISLNVPEGVHVQYIDPVTHLQRMTYYL